MVVNSRRRQLGQQALTELLQVSFRIFNDIEFPAYVPVHNFAEPLFLLLTENIGLIDYLGEYKHGARALRRSRRALLGDDRQTKEKKEPKRKENAGPNHVAIL